MLSSRLDLMSVQEKVVAELRQMIIDGVLEPGASISEVALAESFGVSRTPVREALKQLQTEGLVNIRPRVGTFVSAPSRREVTELFQVKELLEGAAARLLAQRGRVPELDALLVNGQMSDQALKAGDVELYTRLVHEFHDLLIKGSDNLKLEAHYRTLMHQLAYNRLVKTSLAQRDRPSQSDSEHRRVLDAILAKDGDRAEQLMRQHVRSSHRALMDGLDEKERLQREATAD